MCVHNGIQAHRIVQTSLDVAGAVRCRTVVVTHADGDRLSAALEVRANRSTEYTVLILICRLYTDNSVAAAAILAAQEGFAPSQIMPDTIANAFTSV